MPIYVDASVAFYSIESHEMSQTGTTTPPKPLAMTAILTETSVSHRAKSPQISTLYRLVASSGQFCFARLCFSVVGAIGRRLECWRSWSRWNVRYCICSTRVCVRRNIAERGVGWNQPARSMSPAFCVASVWIWCERGSVIFMSCVESRSRGMSKIPPWTN